MPARRLCIAAAAVLIALLQPFPAGAQSRVPPGLVTQHGAAFTDRNLAGAPFAIFFGFTSCPDICPTTLMDLTSDLAALGAAAEKLSVVFVSVDPERDTPERLKEYMGSFDPRIVALSGPADAIAALARAFGAKYRKVPTQSGYTIDHTAAVFLVDRDGETAAVIDAAEPQPQRLAKLRELLQARPAK
ncbi:MAG: SCO family protein [Proteobacteria bacterium]|nr:MAG: SCO family protein [Pseudomonadota bacterium]